MKQAILIQEDDTFLSSQWAKALKVEGYEVACVTCASDAILYLQERSFDLCVVDMIIYGQDGPVADGGVTLVSYVRRSAAKMPTRPMVLGVSAHSSEYGTVPADKLFRRLGADDFLQKPFTIPALIERVRRLLGRPSEARLEASSDG